MAAAGRGFEQEESGTPQEQIHAETRDGHIQLVHSSWGHCVPLRFGGAKFSRMHPRPAGHLSGYAYVLSSPGERGGSVTV